MKSTPLICSNILLILFGCIDTPLSTSNQVPYSSKIVMDKRIDQRQNLLFLDFWFKMNSYDYSIIKDSLIQMGKLVTTDTTTEFTMNLSVTSEYDSTLLENRQVLFDLKPRFVDDSLSYVSLNFIEIKQPSELVSIITSLSYYKENLFHLFVKKYGIPKISKTEDAMWSEKTIMYEWEKDNKVVTLEEFYRLVDYEDYSLFTDYYNLLSYVITYYDKQNYKTKDDAINRQKEIQNETIKRKEIQSYDDI